MNFTYAVWVKFPSESKIVDTYTSLTMAETLKAKLLRSFDTVWITTELF